MPRLRLSVAQLLAIVLLAGIAFGVLRIIGSKNRELADLTERLKRAEEDASRKHETLLAIIGELRDRVPRSNVLDLRAGNVIKVDRERREVVVDLTESQGVRAGMRMAIFESVYPTLVGQSLKGTVELGHVGQDSSTARINKLTDGAEPVVAGDVVYSPAWSPRGPMRFALLGKIDRDRDGKDDRDELKQIIQQAGGVIEFDLPPPEVGPETGWLSPRVDWYVVDEILDRHDPDLQFEKRMGEAIKKARLNGTRPMPFARLLHLLGYS